MSRRALSLTLSVSILLAVPAAGTVAQEAVRIEDDIVVESPDGTPIVATLMLPAEASAETPVPAIIGTHGWAGSRSRSPSGLAARLIDRGYAILTWDSRGFGESGGGGERRRSRLRGRGRQGPHRLPGRPSGDPPRRSGRSQGGMDRRFERRRNPAEHGGLR